MSLLKGMQVGERRSINNLLVSGKTFFISCGLWVIVPEERTIDFSFLYWRKFVEN